MEGVSYSINDNSNLDELIASVASKKGTTEAGLKSFKSSKLSQNFEKGIAAAIGETSKKTFRANFAEFIISQFDWTDLTTTNKVTMAGYYCAISSISSVYIMSIQGIFQNLKWVYV